MLTHGYDVGKAQYFLKHHCERRTDIGQRVGGIVNTKVHAKRSKSQFSWCYILLAMRIAPLFGIASKTFLQRLSKMAVQNGSRFKHVISFTE